MFRTTHPHRLVAPQIVALGFLPTCYIVFSSLLSLVIPPLLDPLVYN